MHHFHIMGQTSYSEYQRKATERLIAVDDKGVTCPNVSCGQSFFWEPYDDDGRSQCPDCFFSFCRYFELLNRKFYRNKYHRSESASKEIVCARAKTISPELQLTRLQGDLSDYPLQKTVNSSRRCPKCHVATERNGGCAHIHCTSCGMDWCFKCKTEWKEECQWDHWFN